jgi:hypothetical protein
VQQGLRPSTVQSVTLRGQHSGLPLVVPTLMRTAACMKQWRHTISRSLESHERMHHCCTLRTIRHRSQAHMRERFPLAILRKPLQGPSSLLALNSSGSLPGARRLQMCCQLQLPTRCVMLAGHLWGSP